MVQANLSVRDQATTLNVLSPIYIPENLICANIYVVVQFYLWFNFYFLLFYIRYHYICIKKNKGK